jgi:hypothetical protein
MRRGKTRTLVATMIATFLQRQRQRFMAWWRAPLTSKDRVLGALVGGIACFWIGVLGRLILGPSPVGFDVLAWWALGSIAFGIALGLIFPKATTCVLFPFSTIGVGGGN